MKLQYKCYVNNLTLYCFLQNNKKKSVCAVRKHYHDRLYKIHNMQRRGNRSNDPTAGETEEVRTREDLPYTNLAQGE